MFSHTLPRCHKSSKLRLLICKSRLFFFGLYPLTSLNLSKVHVIDDEIRCSSLTPKKKKDFKFVQIINFGCKVYCVRSNYEVAF